MKKRNFNLLFMLSIMFYTSCAQKEESFQEKINEIVPQVKKEMEPHRYGGWHCPDNLSMFPAIDLKNWKNVPVVNGRFATEQERSKGASLINVDLVKYPEAKVLPIQLPQLATIYNHNSKREDLIVVIQAFSVQNDSIVGYRYLNGGNGSAWLNDVKMLSDEEIVSIPDYKFVSVNVDILTNQEDIWKVLIRDEYTKELYGSLNEDPNSKELGVNFKNVNTGKVTNGYGGKLYGSYYIQNDFEKMNYTEKFFLSENEEGNKTTLKVVCGPFLDDKAAQQRKIQKWANLVKLISERD